MLNRCRHTRGMIVTVLLLLLMVVPVYAQETAEGIRQEDIKVEYASYRPDHLVPGPAKAMTISVLPENKLEISNWIVDGGCITSEQMRVKSVAQGADGIVTINLVLTLDGAPCKAFFQKVTKTTVQLPEAGRYKIRFFVHELYGTQGEVLVDAQEVFVK